LLLNQPLFLKRLERNNEGGFTQSCASVENFPIGLGNAPQHLADTDRVALLLEAIGAAGNVHKDFELGA
jgi:hypothetical protein